MKIISYLFPYMKKHIKSLGILIVLNLVSMGFGLALPVISGKYIDFLINIKKVEVVYYFSLLIFIIGTINIILNFNINTFNTRVTTECAFSINQSVIKHLQKVPLTYTHQFSSTFLTEQINNDSNELVSFFLNIYLNVFIKGAVILISFIIIFSISPLLTFVLVSVVPLYVLFYFLMKKKLYKHTYLLKNSQSSFFSALNQQLNHMKTIKINVFFNACEKSLAESFNRFFQTLMKYIKVINFYGSGNTFIFVTTNLVVSFLGGIEIVRDRLSIGEFVIITTYVNMLINSVQFYFDVGKKYQQALVSMDRIEKHLNVRKEKNGQIKLSSIENITIKDLSVSYKPSNEPILSKIDFRFDKGGIYCIVGRNGTGKSTFINTLLGIHEDYDGEIILEGQDLESLDKYDLRSNLISVIEQEPCLLDPFIENLSQTDYHTFIRTFELERVIEAIKDNEKQNLTTSLSGGEKQKLAFIYMLSKNADVLILDEPTSALDTKSVEKIKEVLLELKENKIVILISHDIRMSAFADEVINLDCFKAAVPIN